MNPGDPLREVLDAYERQGLLFRAQLDLLHQCDLACEHCYLDGSRAPRPKAATFWRGVLDQIREMQAMLVVMSGGEVFLRDDLLEVVAHARALGLVVHLGTHGGHLDDAMVRRLAAIGGVSVTLSYYSTRPDVHDAITRRSGSQARTLAAIERLVQSGVPTKVNVPVLDRNVGCHREVLDQCREMGVAVGLGRRLFPARSGARYSRKRLVSLDQRVEIERVVGHERAPEAHERDAAEWDDAKLCGAGRSSIYVGPDGDVTPCVMWPEAVGNLARGDRLADLWEHSELLQRIRGWRRRDLSECVGCPVRTICSPCPAAAFLERGDPLLAPVSVCEAAAARARARAEERGEPPPPMPGGLRESDHEPDVAQ